MTITDVHVGAAGLAQYAEATGQPKPPKSKLRRFSKKELAARKKRSGEASSHQAGGGKGGKASSGKGTDQGKGQSNGQPTGGNGNDKGKGKGWYRKGSKGYVNTGNPAILRKWIKKGSVWEPWLPYLETVQETKGRGRGGHGKKRSRGRGRGA